MSERMLHLLNQSIVVKSWDGEGRPPREYQAACMLGFFRDIIAADWITIAAVNETEILCADGEGHPVVAGVCFLPTDFVDLTTEDFEGYVSDFEFMLPMMFARAAMVMRHHFGPISIRCDLVGVAYDPAKDDTKIFRLSDVVAPNVLDEELKELGAGGYERLKNKVMYF